MAFRCPDCSTPGWLLITDKIELPPDSRSDEIMLQIVKCGRCRFEAIAVYEESRRGGLGDESVDHRGYFVNKADLKFAKGLISKCPNPTNSKCRCRAHKELSRKDQNGRWDGLGNIDLGKRFAMQIR